MSAPETLCENLLVLRDRPISVSYTHLDVYKRQILCTCTLLMTSEIVNFSKCYEWQDTETAQKLLFTPYSLKLPSQRPATFMGCAITLQSEDSCITLPLRWVQKTMLSDKQFQSSRESQRFEKDRRPKCYNCGNVVIYRKTAGRRRYQDKRVIAPVGEVKPQNLSLIHI